MCQVLVNYVKRKLIGGRTWRPLFRRLSAPALFYQTGPQIFVPQLESLPNTKGSSSPSQVAFKMATFSSGFHSVRCVKSRVGNKKNAFALSAPDWHLIRIWRQLVAGGKQTDLTMALVAQFTDTIRFPCLREFKSIYYYRTNTCLQCPGLGSNVHDTHEWVYAISQ